MCTGLLRGFPGIPIAQKTWDKIINYQWMNSGIYKSVKQHAIQHKIYKHMQSKWVQGKVMAIQALRHCSKNALKYISLTKIEVL